jgi:methylase of polypeptide subunit release factors
VLQINDAFSTNFEEIDIDPFWNVGNETEHKNHRIHAYPAKFPAFITQKAIQYARAEGISVNCIADIFCGCGTVAFEAKRLDIDFWGCDLNPTAVLIAKAKSSNYDNVTTQKYFDTIIRKFDDKYLSYSTPQVVNERISYWFYQQEIRDLSLLKECILTSVPIKSKYRYYFLCAFSNILKPTSKWLTKSIKPQIDPQKKPISVRQAFVKQCKIMAKATADISEFPHAKKVIEQKDALTIKRRQFADLIISSPPYVTSYEYADLHQLSTLWLEYADDYRDLRQNSIGSTHSVFDESIISSLNRSGRAIFDELSNVDKSKARGVAKYYLDMQKITTICKSALRNNGMMLMVIGNTEYKGVHIDNVKHLVESMQSSEFQRIFVTKRKISGKILTPYRDENGRFSASSDKRKIYSEEFIVVGR